jgi:hypothetical protein
MNKVLCLLSVLIVGIFSTVQVIASDNDSDDVMELSDSDGQSDSGSDGDSQDIPLDFDALSIDHQTEPKWLCESNSQLAHRFNTLAIDRALVISNYGDRRDDLIAQQAALMAYFDWLSRSTQISWAGESNSVCARRLFESANID